MTVTVAFLVEPEEQADTVRVNMSRSRMAARRILVTLAAIGRAGASPDRSRFVKDRFTVGLCSAVSSGHPVAGCVSYEAARLVRVRSGIHTTSAMMAIPNGTCTTVRASLLASRIKRPHTLPAPAARSVQQHRL